MSSKQKSERDIPVWFTHKISLGSRKKAQTSVSKLDKVTKGLAIYAAVLTTILTTFTFFEKVTPKKHKLEVFVSDYHSGSKFVDFTVAYYNSGDYTEVLSNVSLYLAQEVEGYKAPMYFEQASCRTPAIVEKGKTVYKTYRAKIDYQNPDMSVFSSQTQNLQLALHFDFLSKEYGRAFARFPVANVIPTGNKINIDFATTKKEIDFDDARPVVVKSTYPIDKEYEKPNFCGKEI